MTYRPNLPLSAATLSQAGLVKPDGTTLTTAADGTTSVVGVAVTALTDISSGSLGGPALSDVDTVNRGGTDYKVTLSARSSLFRKTPAGSRTIALVTGSAIATLTGSDNDKQVVVTGIPGTLTVDGTISDGFRCLVINKTSGGLSYSGITGLSNTTALPSGSYCTVYMAASATEATAGATATISPATTSALGGIKPDGTTLTATSDGTLSVVTVSTHALTGGAGLTAGDEFATYSLASTADVKYTASQIAIFVQSNVQSWPTTGRPTLGSAQFGLGFNSTTNTFDFWNGAGWQQYCRTSDLSATAGQLFGGTGTSGVAAAVTVGSGLNLAGNTLTATGGVSATVPVTTISASGASQALVFPASGSRAYDLTLTGNCTLSLSGGSSGELQTITLVIRGGAGGFSITLPSGIKWPGGVIPTMDTSAGSYNEVYIRTIDGGATYSGTY